MIRTWLPATMVSLASLLAGPLAWAQQGPSPEQINQAIDQGVAFLKQSQSVDGTWTYPGHDLGMTALGGLALFESQVPRDDPAITRAEQYVLLRAPNETQTYDLGLAILFLSRLHPNDQGEVRDLIRKLAWRLAAGERGGGWTYTNPLKPTFPMPILERSTPAVLTSATPASGESGGRPEADSGGMVAAPGSKPIAAESGGTVPSVAGLGGVASSVPTGSEKSSQADDRAGTTKPVRAAENQPEPDEDDSPSRANPGQLEDREKAASPEKPATTRNNARRPNPRVEARTRQKQLQIIRSFGDHSNTQFGMLGVWTAGQYGYDSRSTLTNLGIRFHLCQRADGAWGYRADGSVVHGPEAMTCVGLLALYLSAGIDDGDGRDALSRGQELEQDRTYRRGLEAVTSYARKLNRTSPTYFLWSLERLCVALGKETLDGFDWYKAGAQVLVDRQQLDGSWNDGQWGQAPDTCLALLFLHRSNLARGIENAVRLAEYKDISGLPTLAKRVDPPGGPIMPPDEPSPPENELPVVTIPNPTNGDRPDRQAEDVAVTQPPDSPTSNPSNDPTRLDRPSSSEPAGESVSFEPRLQIIVVVALLILMSLPALTGRWLAEP